MKKTRRLTAIFMVVLLVAGMLPINYLGGSNKVSAMTTGAATSNILDAQQLSLDLFQANEGIIGADTPVGTDDFYTLLSRGGKIKMVDLTETPLSYNSMTFKKAVQLTGGMKTSGQAAIQFVIPEGKQAVVNIYASAKSSSESYISYCPTGASEITKLKALEEGIITKTTIDDLGAGTYYLGGSNGANIYYIEVKYTEKNVLSALDLSLDLFGAVENTISTDTTVGANNFYTLMSRGSKIKMVDLTAAPVTYDDVEYTKALQLTGGLKSTGQAGVKITTTDDARVTIYAAAKGASASSIQYMNMSGNAVTFDTLTENVISKTTIDKLEAGSYYLGGTNGANIFKIVVEYIDYYTVNAMDDSLIANTSISTDTTVGSDDFLTLMSRGTKNKIADISSSPKTYDGVEYTKAIQLGGKYNAGTGQSCMKFTTTETSKLTIIAGAKGASESILSLIDVDTQEVVSQIGILDATQVPNKYTLSDIKPGTYYIGGSNGGNFYDILVEYDPADVILTPWDNIETPVINSVTVDGNGDFVVDFTANINEVTGGECAKVTMYESGFEVDTATVKAQASSVVMSPLWSGNYTFRVTLVRTGEAYKESADISYSNYILAVPKPVITWAQNKGNGDFYIDWVNTADADSYSVYYRTKGSSDYTAAATDITAADYTFKGLTQGTYDIKVTAKRESDGFISSYEKEVEVSSNSEQPWYVATVGSAQETNATITDSSGNITTHSLSSKDTVAVKTNNEAAVSIANTNGTITINGSDSGKISDDEDGFMYYYTKIDPDTENFSLSAKFTITDVSRVPDNQTGFGVVAADTLGINNFGAPDYVHKYFNYASSMLYSSKSTKPVMRNVLGYVSSDTSNNDGVDRVREEQKFSSSSTSFEVGKSYAFALEKTNDSYIATCNGETLNYGNTAFTSVQEDGTVCVGVMVSRKVSAEISELTFQTSESTGVNAGEAKSDKITPSATVYSSDTCGSTSYEYIYQPNVAGKLTVTSPAGNIVFNENVSASQVVRVNVPIAVGDNTITSKLVQAAGQNVTSTSDINKTTKVKCVQYGIEGETIIVSADATADGKGTQESPLDIYTAVKYAQPGQVIYLKNGEYTGAYVTIGRSVSGTADKNITMVAEETGKVVFKNMGITLVGSYWHIFGIYVENAPGVGIQISGNNNIIDMCVVKGSGNSGVQISRSGSADNKAGINGRLWPSDNLIKNCESYDNCDAGRNDADGFAAKLTCGEGNKFYGCIAHNNIDDGWDLYAKSISGEIGAVEIENCVAYNNGWLTTDDVSAEGYKYGEGNGFKLGGGYLKGGHTLKNSITFNNHSKGITSNSCPDCSIYNCTSYNNSLLNDSYNIGLNTKASNVKEWVVEGLISLNNDKNTKYEDLIPFSLHSENNYIYNGSSSYNKQGVQATEDWFVNVDTKDAFENQKVSRNENGTINMQDGLLQLTEQAPSNTGARLDITSEKAISVKPEMTDIVGTTQVPEEPTNPENPTDPENPTVPENPTNPEDSTENTWAGEVVSPSDTVIKNDELGIGAIVSDDIIFKNSNNISISKESVSIKVVAKGIEAENAKSKLEKAFEEKGIVIASDASIQYYDVSMVGADGNKVKFENGKIKLVFAYPEGVSKDGYEFRILHLLDDGTVEVLEPTVIKDGMVVEVDSLSPFAVVYREKISGSVSDTSIVATGDHNPIMLYVVILAISGGCVLFGMTRKKRKRA